MAINKKKKLVVVGLGECGLATLAYQRAKGPYRSIGFSFDEERVKALNSREARFEEEALRTALYKGKDFFSSDPTDLKESDIFYLCLEDEIIDENNETILKLIESLKENEKGEIAIIIRGIYPVGTTRKIKEFCKKELENKKILLLYIPSFESGGKYYLGEKDPYRIVIGFEDKEEETLGLKLYASLISKGIPSYSATYEEAELSTLACHSYFSLKSAFSYEIGKEGDRHGCDIDVVAQILGSDPRIGRTFLTPKTLYRGDGEALSSLLDLPITKHIQEDRRREAEDIVAMLKGAIGELRDKKISLIGLGNGGLLEKPLAVLIYPLLKEECYLDCFDFSLLNEKAFAENFPETSIKTDFFETIKDSEAILFLSPSSSLSALQEKDLLPLAKGRTIIDCCGAIDRRKFRYFDILSLGKRPQFKETSNQ